MERDLREILTQQNVYYYSQRAEETQQNELKTKKRQNEAPLSAQSYPSKENIITPMLAQHLSHPVQTMQTTIQTNRRTNASSSLRPLGLRRRGRHGAAVLKASGRGTHPVRRLRVENVITPTTNTKATTTTGCLGLAAAALFHAPAAFAAAAENAVPSAFAAYGHYLGLLLIVGSLATEKAILKPNMSGDELMKLVIADSVYGIAGVLVLYTGYLRVTQYGKGWEFYSHEPIFWFKMFLFAVMGSSSLFVTIKTITTFAEKQKSTDENETYISEKLATRMGKVLNGELLAVLAIPLAATTMSRGILFQQEMDWHLGAAPVALASAGLGFKYVKEALTWSED